MSKKLILILVCSLFAISGCNIIYKQNIQQGNAIEQDKLDQLKLGMTMNQVAFLLGTPAVRDPFHQQRWDYYYSFSIRGGDPLTRLVTLNFDNAVLSAIKGADFDDQQAVVNAATQAEALPTDEGEIGEETISPQEPDEPVISAIETPMAVSSELITVSEAGAEVSDVVEDGMQEAQIMLEEAPVIEEATETTLAVSSESITDSEAGTEVSEVVEDAIQEAEEMVEEAAIIEEAVLPEATSEAIAESKWVIQLGAFESLANAEALLEQMETEGYVGQVTLQKSRNLDNRYLVRTPGFESKAQAQEQLDSINSSLELDGFLIPPVK
ncbi:MAG: outer membrane protein assembly factor BamE [Lysobacterales bacterium]|jgi:outer membrane protein assembly factor BamE